MSSEMQAIIFFILLGILGVFLLWFFIFKVKHLKIPDVFLITGGVKTGKSFVSVWLAVRTYKRNLRKVKFINFLIKFIANPVRNFKNLFRKYKGKAKAPYKYREIPMLYSNMHLRNIKYNLLSLEIIKRQVRIPTKSVVLIDEVSLLADSMLGKVGGNKRITKVGKYEKVVSYDSDIINEELMLFVKLFGHYCGGTLIVNTQALCDCHYAFKRCISSYLWIENKRKFPFFSLLSVRELAHSEDNDIINNFDKDSEVDNRPLFILNKYMKYYDYRCYSIFTDGLELQVNYDNPIKHKKDSLKTNVLLTLQDFKTLKEFANKGMEVKQKELEKKEVKEVKNNEKA